jgi:hypothetical protein
MEESLVFIRRYRKDCFLNICQANFIHRVQGREACIKEFPLPRRHAPHLLKVFRYNSVREVREEQQLVRVRSVRAEEQSPSIPEQQPSIPDRVVRHR